MLIAIIGIDGCGKTTQAQRLVESLCKEGRNAVYLRPVYSLLTLFSRGAAGKPVPLSPRKARTSGKRGWPGRSLLLGIAGYAYALLSYVYIRLCVERGRIIVCDRYFYQFFYDIAGRYGYRLSRLFPRPDAAFFLTGRVETAFGRMTSRVDREIDRGYYENVIVLMEEVAGRYGFTRLDADAPLEELHETIYAAVTGKQND